MKKVWIYRRKGRKGYSVLWRENGRQLSKTLPTKALAEHYKQIKYAAINSDVFVGTAEVVWDELTAEYLRTKQVAGLAESSMYDVQLTLDHFRRLIGPASSKQLTQRLVDEFVIARAEEVKKHTLNKDIRNFAAFIRWGQASRYIGAEVAIKQMKTARRTVKPLGSAQVHNLLVAAAPATWYIRILLAVTTGLRKNDIEQLRVTDINFETNSIDTHSRKTLKTMLDRPLPQPVTLKLADYVNSLPAGQVRLFADTNTHKTWRRIRKRAGLPNLRFQDLRVTFGSMLQQHGQPLSVAQRLLEHSTPNITARYYTNVDPVLRNAVESLPIKDWF